MTQNRFLLIFIVKISTKNLFIRVYGSDLLTFRVVTQQGDHSQGAPLG